MKMPSKFKSLSKSIIIIFIYEFLSRIASSVLKVNCYQWGSCVGGPSAFNSPFGHRSRSHNICPLDNHLSGLSISLSSLVFSWVYRLPFFKSLVWLGCDSNSQPSVLMASTLPLHYQSVVMTDDHYYKNGCVLYHRLPDYWNTNSWRTSEIAVVWIKEENHHLW